jgi:hypothetical protein
MNLAEISPTLVVAVAAAIVVSTFLLLRRNGKRLAWRAAGIGPSARSPVRVTRSCGKRSHRPPVIDPAHLTKSEAEDLLDWLEANGLPPCELKLSPEGYWQLRR